MWVDGTSGIDEVARHKASKGDQRPNFKEMTILGSHSCVEKLLLSNQKKGTFTRDLACKYKNRKLRQCKRQNLILIFHSYKRTKYIRKKI